MSILGVLGGIAGSLGGGLGLGSSSTTNINTNSNNTSQVGVNPSISVSLGGGITSTPSSALDAQAPTTQRADSQPASSLLSDGLGAGIETFSTLPTTTFDPTLTAPSTLDNLLPIILLGAGAFFVFNQ